MCTRQQPGTGSSLNNRKLTRMNNIFCSFYYMFEHVYVLFVWVFEFVHILSFAAYLPFYWNKFDNNIWQSKCFSKVFLLILAHQWHPYKLRSSWTVLGFLSIRVISINSKPSPSVHMMNKLLVMVFRILFIF